MLAIYMFFSSALSFDFLAKAVNNSETVSGLKKEYIIKVRSFNDAKKVASDLNLDSKISATYPDDDPSTTAVNDGKPVYYPNQVFCNGTPVALNSFYTS